MFAPVKDRGGAGKGFTHKVGDVVADLDAVAGHAQQHGAAVHRVRRHGPMARAICCEIWRRLDCCRHSPPLRMIDGSGLRRDDICAWLNQGAQRTMNEGTTR